MAEGVGFEPTEPCGSPVFKTGAIDHSATPPQPPSRERYANLCPSATASTSLKPINLASVVNRNQQHLVAGNINVIDHAIIADTQFATRASPQR